VASVLSFAKVTIGPAPQIELPIGISFITFQALSYIADVYTHKVVPARSLLNFGMYHSLFPQLIAGPIVR
jgi:alginate O-acetyltransferase complex protein AlgI